MRRILKITREKNPHYILRDKYKNNGKFIKTIQDVAAKLLKYKKNKKTCQCIFYTQ